MRTTKWRLIHSTGSTPYMNMAVDEALFLLSEKHSPAVRFYGWKEKTFTIGYFQKVSELKEKYSLLGEKSVFVRRITGGGLVEHGKDLTYSISCSKPEKYFDKGVKETYKKINSVFAGAIEGFEGEVAIEGDRGTSLGRGVNCFREMSPFDIVLGGVKVGGAAQRRTEGRFIQQGSIRLGDSEVKFMFDSFVKLFREEFEAEIEIEELAEDEIELAEKLCEEKYVTRDWNYLK